MHVEALVKMANQIATFFEAMPDRPAALAEMAQHIKRFWEPRMRHELLAHADNGGEGLSAVAFEAIRRNRAQIV